MLAKEIMASFPAHYSGQNVCTSASIDGIATSSAGEPLSLPLTAPSGLSRPQFLVVSQALGVPFFPNYCKDQGGLVRMLMRHVLPNAIALYNCMTIEQLGRNRMH